MRDHFEGAAQGVIELEQKAGKNDIEKAKQRICLLYTSVIRFYIMNLSEDIRIIQERKGGLGVC